MVAFASAGEESPNTTRQHAAEKPAEGRGESPGRWKVSQRTYRHAARKGRAVRVKRRGKSPPPGGQPPGHDKPHAVQGQTGTPGCLPGAGRKTGARPGYRSQARREAPSAGEKSRREMNDRRRGAFSKRRGTEFGLCPTPRRALRETGAPFAF